MTYLYVINSLYKFFLRHKMKIYPNNTYRFNNNSDGTIRGYDMLIKYNNTKNKEEEEYV